MQQWQKQQYKQPNYKLPPVPEYKPGRIPPVIYIIMYLAVIVLLVVGAVWGVRAGTTSIFSMTHPQHTPTVTLRPKKPTPTPSPIVLSNDMQKALQDSCPDASPTSHATKPSLDFCSPKYYGDVAGPVGSHITLIGEHLPAQPQQWALVKKTQQSSPTSLSDENKLQTCISQAQNCIPLAVPPSIIKNYLPAFSLYTWTWAPTFPTDTTDYFIVASGFSTQSTQLLWSSVSFTLTTNQAPCISIVKADKTSSGDCTQKRSFTVTGNDQVTIHGTNWILGWKNQPPPGVTISSTVNVNVTISCKKDPSCSSPTLLDLQPKTIAVQPDGTFDLQFTVPAQTKGTYIVTAVCLLQQPIATPGLSANSKDNINTIVGNALTFGQDGDETGLTLEVS